MICCFAVWLAVPDEIERYVALLHAAGGWACIAAHYEMVWYTALLYPPLFGTRRAAPCWPVESLALLNIAAAQGYKLTLCPVAMAQHCCCAKSAPLPSIPPHLWLVHGQRHSPCPSHDQAGHWKVGESARRARCSARG